MTKALVRTRRDGHILEVPLDRPKADAINLATSRIMGGIFTRFCDDLDLRVAMELPLTVRWIDVEESHLWGSANRIHPAADLTAGARAIATALASGPPLVFGAIKEFVRECEAMEF